MIGTPFSELVDNQVSEPSPVIRTPELDDDLADHSFCQIACLHCGHTLTVPVYCGNRFCPVCSVARLSRVRRRLEWIVTHIDPASGYGFKFLTLTIRNEPDLAGMLKHLVKSFRKLRQRAFWKQYVAGGAFVLEVTGRPGNWHAHLHVIIEARFIPYDKLLALWKLVSGSQGVWIEKMPKKNIVGYLTKYLSKCSVPDFLTDDISEAISGFRLFQPFGNWYAVNLTFQTKKQGCPTCGRHSFLPMDILYRMCERDGVLIRPP
ncbi:hypothetical protein ES703_69164 [subsurface metagenome]